VKKLRRSKSIFQLGPRIGPTRITSKDFSLRPGRETCNPDQGPQGRILDFHTSSNDPHSGLPKRNHSARRGGRTIRLCPGSAEKNEFHSIKIGVAIDQSMIEFLEDTCLLRPKFAYELLGAIPPPKKGEPKPTGPEPGGPGEPTTPTKGGPEAYESVSVTSDLDWKKWMEFHDARARRSRQTRRSRFRALRRHGRRSALPQTKIDRGAYGITEKSIKVAGVRYLRSDGDVSRASPFLVSSVGCFCRRVSSCDCSMKQFAFSTAHVQV
jgi:hypothetical protein